MLLQEQFLDRLRRLIVSDNPTTALFGVLLVCLMAGGLVGMLFGGLGPIIALAAIGAITLGYLMLQGTLWGFIGMIGVITLLPYATFPFKIGFTPTFLNAVFVALYGVWFVKIVTGSEKSFTATPVGMPIFAFLAWSLVTFIAGLSHASLSLTVLRNYAEVILAVLLVFVAVNQIQTRGQLRLISQSFMLAGGALGIIGIVFYVIPGDWTVAILSRLGRIGYPTDGILRYIEDNPENAMRAIATSIDPNALGGLLVMMTIIAVAHSFARKPVLPRWLALGITGLLGILLFLTFSRGSMLGVVTAMGVIGLLRYRRLIWLMLAGLPIVALLPQTQTYVTRFIEGIRGEDLATQMRFGEYKDAFILIERYPIMGVGFSGAPDIDLYIGVSSVYLLIAQQMGLVGMGLFVLVNLVFFNTIFKTWRKLPQGHHLEGPILGFTLAVFGAMVSGLFDHFFFNILFVHLVALYWLSMGLALSAAQLAEVELADTT